MAALVFKSLRSKHRLTFLPPHCRTLIDISTINWVRDRALDHAVEKEKNLQPLIQLKNLIKSEPSKSLPLSVIVEKKGTLQIPSRPIEFIRKYPSIFEEFSPGGLAVQPHVKITDDVLSLDSDEELMFSSDSYRKDVADRLLKLLMLSRINKIPLSIINRLKWDLGLPNDSFESFIRDFPDYFCVNNDGFLELVCWSDELAVSVMEKRARKENVGGYRNGMPLSFPTQYSRGFDMDKKFKKGVDDWQKLPYISPYENASHLGSSTDESDKWTTGILHELLHILVPKKTDKEHLLCLGEYMGLRSRFKRALLHHPGIFYLSSKIGMHTVVLREGYKRDLLVEKHVMMGMRSQYIHLMNTVKEVPKSNGSAQSISSQQDKKQRTADPKRKEREEDEKDTGLSAFSDSEADDIGKSDAYDDNDDEDSDTEVESEDRRRTNSPRVVPFSRGTRGRNLSLDAKAPLQRNGEQDKPVREYSGRSRGSDWSRGSKRSDLNHGKREPLPEKSIFSRRSRLSEMHGRQEKPVREFSGKTRDSDWSRGSKRSDLNLGKREPLPEKSNFSRRSRISEMPGRQEKPVREFSSETRDSDWSRASKKSELNAGKDNVRERLSKRSDFSTRPRRSEMPNPQGILRGKLLTETRDFQMSSSETPHSSRSNERSTSGKKRESRH